MINIKITRRSLKENEINLLMNDIKLYPDLIYVKKSSFKKYKNPYIVKYKNEFVGLCAIYQIENWIKPGPFVFLKKFHGKGYGKILLNKIVGDYSNKNIFITSSNTAVQKIISRLNFKEVDGIFNLPTSILLQSIKFLFECFHWKVITEFIRKKFTMKRNTRKYYVKIV